MTRRNHGLRGDRTPEKRKVGVSPPPLTTHSEQAKRPGGSLRPGRLTATVTAIAPHGRLGSVNPVRPPACVGPCASHTWLDRGGAEGDLMELNGRTAPQMHRERKSPILAESTGCAE